MDLLLPLTSEIASALDEFWSLAGAWDLSEPEEAVILNVPRPSYLQWKNGTSTMVFGLDLRRLTSLLQLHAKWMKEHGSEQQVSRWLREPNPEDPFEGSQPLQFLLCASTASLQRMSASCKGAPAQLCVSATSSRQNHQIIHV
jgi:hypothetical protein